MTNFPPSDEHDPSGISDPDQQPQFIDEVTLDPDDFELALDAQPRSEADADLSAPTDDDPMLDEVGNSTGTTDVPLDTGERPTLNQPEIAAETPSTPLDAINADLTDDDLLAAAASSLHDEADMVTPSPDAAGSDPTRDTPGFGAGDPTDPGFVPPSSGPPGHQPPRPQGPPAGCAPVPGPRRLYRSRHDRRLGGVSAGIAEYFGIDPTLVRLATLLAAVTGVGILVYIAAWFIVPLRPEGFIEAPRTAPVASERTMTLAFGIAALALAFGIATGSWAVLAIALIGGGVWLLSEHTAIAPGFTGPASGHVSAYQPTAGFEPTMGSTPPSAPYYPPATGFVTPPPPAQPAPVKERTPQRVTWTVLSLLALLTAVGLAAASGDWWDVSATRFLGIGVVIIGVGVVVGQLRRGGARGLIPLGILGALALFPVSAVDGLLDEGVGEANYRPTTIAELEAKYEHGIGQMIVDLSELDFEGRSESVDIDLGIGELIVIVSEDTGGQAVLQAKAGEISHMLPRTNSMLFEEGVNIETGTVVLQGESGTVDLNINVGLGTAELRSEDN